MDLTQLLNQAHYLKSIQPHKFQGLYGVPLTKVATAKRNSRHRRRRRRRRAKDDIPEMESADGTGGHPGRHRGHLCRRKLPFRPKRTNKTPFLNRVPESKRRYLSRIDLSSFELYGYITSAGLRSRDSYFDDSSGDSESEKIKKPRISAETLRGATKSERKVMQEVMVGRQNKSEQVAYTQGNGGVVEETSFRVVGPTAIVPSMFSKGSASHVEVKWVFPQKDIEFEEAGYVMSGSRHRRTNTRI
ncbi:hypothetical protein RJ640_014310 [Escallonia rubra]|uniref:Uncharacterized protein n=1 Tax=Escallonia rubra TaxID=112253 RepID=A0AA88QPH7_9ASTE|nr:hypothetical protein RJ640_014310 [Escallonia rubra]